MVNPRPATRVRRTPDRRRCRALGPRPTRRPPWSAATCDTRNATTIVSPQASSADARRAARRAAAARAPTPWSPDSCADARMSRSSPSSARCVAGRQAASVAPSPAREASYHRVAASGRLRAASLEGRTCTSSARSRHPASRVQPPGRRSIRRRGPPLDAGGPGPGRGTRRRRLASDRRRCARLVRVCGGCWHLLVLPRTAGAAERSGVEAGAGRHPPVIGCGDLVPTVGPPMAVRTSGDRREFLERTADDGASSSRVPRKAPRDCAAVTPASSGPAVARPWPARGSPAAPSPTCVRGR
ncbi:hypothetical protein SAMN05660657_03564 [Geodermatophilus amargosae]|uniref:Uncharacterized protein n=1 Tax=Geodermatophilus amargosae TaxID=1296565 RepID=A0A1I7BGZ3_9ACTN|nr:hypothetical protein SAMN05660657_03564 [Geodermatophilus amargosae]